MNKTNLAQIVVIMLSAVWVGACARTVVQPETEIRNFGLPRPKQILVYDFAVTEAEVTDHRPAEKNPRKRAALRKALGRSR